MKDEEVENLIHKEEKRQEEAVNLIASENYVSNDVRSALGSVLVNKYSEGYPAERYYAGNNVIDEVECLAQHRALSLFSLADEEWNVNVQPLSGTPANLAIYSALVPLGGKIMGMKLSHGGHLSHGHSISLTGKLWKQVPYGVSRESELLDYEEIGKQAEKEKPKIIVAGFTAYPRAVDFKAFRTIADSVGAYLVADISHIAGLIATGYHPSPFLYADVVMSTTHKSLRGPRSALIFSRLGSGPSGSELASKIDKAVFPGLQGGPHENQIAAVAVALREAAEPEFKKYIGEVLKNAKALADELGSLGWRLISGGTDTHLLVVDVWMKGEGIGGKEASERLEKAGIIVNKNTIPFDERKPADPSGIRLGTLAETTRGKKEEDMKEIARRIDTILRS
ncbi:MAG: serine hydroxymethyltransferase [Candidatus Paceibacterota bacterium]